MADIDIAQLTDWLKQSVPGFKGPVTVEKFAHGQSNPTYRLASPSGRFVLRRKPFGHLLPSAHQVDREYRLLAALHPTGYPVPLPVALCEDDEIIGATFYVMELVEGRVHIDATLPGDTPENRRRIYDAMIDQLAALHQIDHEKAGLAAFGKPGNYFARQVDRWTRQYRAAQTDDIADMEALAEWLAKTVPEQERISVIHGDYRMDNLVIHPDKPEVAAVLDWELATIGDPLADFAYLAINWLIPADGASGLAGLDLAALGIPDLAAATARYCAATGRDGVPKLEWYYAFNIFRLASILQGVKKRGLDGNASNATALMHGARIIPLAKIGWEQARIAGAT